MIYFHIVVLCIISSPIIGICHFLLPMTDLLVTTVHWKYWRSQNCLYYLFVPTACNYPETRDLESMPPTIGQYLG